MGSWYGCHEARLHPCLCFAMVLSPAKSQHTGQPLGLDVPLEEEHLVSAANYLTGMRKLGCSQWRGEDDSSAVPGWYVYLFPAEGQGKLWFSAALGLSQDIPAVCCSADDGCGARWRTASSFP